MWMLEIEPRFSEQPVLLTNEPSLCLLLNILGSALLWLLLVYACHVKVLVAEGYYSAWIYSVFIYSVIGGHLYCFHSEP